MSRQDPNESNDYSFMLQSIEKKLTSTITAQVNDFYKNNQPTKNVAASPNNNKNNNSNNQNNNNDNTTIELPSQIMGLHSPPNTAGKIPFIDHSLSSIKHNTTATSLLKKRRISHDSVLNSDEITFDDHTGDVVQAVARSASVPFSKTITLQSQIDELNIVNEAQKEQIKRQRAELDHLKDTSVKQLTFLDTQNKTLKKDLEEKTHKYYEDKKKWQLKVREIEQQYQKRSAGLMGTDKNSSTNHFTQYIEELQQQVQSLNTLLGDKLNEHETINQQKLSLEKKTILLENELKSLKMQLQFNNTHSNSSNNNDNTSGATTIPKEQYYQLEEKLVYEKSNNQKQLQQLEKQLQQKNIELQKCKDSVKNQLLLEEDILQLKNQHMLFEEKKEEFLETERKYFSLVEEKKHWQSIFTKIQTLLLPALNENTNTNNNTHANTLNKPDETTGLSHMKILSLIQSLQEKYLLLLNDNQQLQSKVNLLTSQQQQRDKEFSDLLLQNQQAKKELERREVGAGQSNQQNKTYEREVNSLRQLLKTYDFEFSLNTNSNKASSSASNKSVTEETMMKLKNEVIERLQGELDEVRRQYYSLLTENNQLQQDKQSISQQQHQLEQRMGEMKTAAAMKISELEEERERSQGAKMMDVVPVSDDSEEVREWKEKYEELLLNYQQLQEISGIDFLPHKTKILRLIDNPSMKNFPELSSSITVQSSTFPPDHLLRLKTENKQLRSEVERLQNASHTSTANNNNNNELNLSDEHIGQGSSSSSNNNNHTNNNNSSIVDPNKLNQRLKEIFREKINTLRHGIYLLTGYQIELSSTEALPRFKLKSVYAENGDDYLLFQMDGDKIELLETKYALTLDASAMSYLSKYQSFPAFLSNLTLQLFENQTFMA